MGRMIDANALLSEMEKYSDDTARSKNEYLFGMQQRLETCIELVEDAPTVDAVPVVRCKDCMHYGFTDNRIPEEQVWWCYFWDDVRSPDAYCSDGEREDSEHEKAD